MPPLLPPNEHSQTALACPPTAPDLLAQTAAERFGLAYLFPYQRLVISNTLEACGYLGAQAAEGAPRFQIALLPTGSGKTLCFTLPALLIPGLTVVVFPLLGLIADQERRLKKDRIPCVRLIGGQGKKERREIGYRLEEGKIRVLLTNPESLLSEGGRRLLARKAVDHLVFDEAHTICEWGETFRPAYLESGTIVQQLQPTVLTAFTATAGEAITANIARYLLPGTCPHIIRANPDRPNITYSVVPSLMKMHDLTALLRPRMPSEADQGSLKQRTGQNAQQKKGKVAAPLTNTIAPAPVLASARLTSSAAGGPAALLPPVPRPAIIFCRSRKSAELTASGLRRRLHDPEIYFYHAGLNREEKKGIEEWFFHSNCGVLAATTAYGMGVDKADVRTVIHRELSTSVEAFLQESGRAGRDGGLSHSVVLLGPEEERRAQRLGKSPEGQRFSELLRVCRAEKGCRRELLLSLMGGAPEACFGCDLCAGSLPAAAFGEYQILDLLKHRPLRYSQKEAARLLCAVRDHKSRQPDIPGARYYGALACCTEGETIEAIESLCRMGLIRTVRSGPWKALLRLSRSGAARQREIKNRPS